LLEARRTARAARDFARADAIRDELAAMGVAIEDGPQGTRWKIAN
jgi:cysteinyl-tRNA synthetase